MSHFEGKRAVVTGGGTGIGRATAIRFAEEGMRVAVLGRRLAPLEETLSLVQGGEHLALSCDVSSVESVNTARDQIIDEFGGIDVLVNNAGVAKTMDPVDTPLADWLMPINVMMKGAVHCTRAFVPHMAAGGRVVNVTSIHRDKVERGASAYATAKGAMTQYTRACALEFADRGILVNAVAPGFTDTPMSRDENGVSELATDWFRENYVDGHHLPLRRAADPAEVAGVVFFLAGPDATYITGETITVDGGLTITF